MNDLFLQHAFSYGESGKKWLEKIPGIIADHEKKWSIRVTDLFENEAQKQLILHV